jgi:valyl-tRNA synthetase
MPFITEEIWHAIFDGKPPLRSIALTSYPQAGQEQVDLIAETEMAVLQDLIVSIRQLRLDLQVESKTQVPIELFVHGASTSVSIMQNWEAIRRLANVDGITNVEGWQARQAPSRSTSRFDVRIPPENFARKIDIEAEYARLKKELDGLNKQFEVAAFQLTNQSFLAKAPAKVVEGLRKQLSNTQLLRDKTLSKLDEFVKIDPEVRRTYLKNELAALNKQIEVAAFQLGDTNLLIEKPKKVVDGLRRQLEDTLLLRDKTQNELNELK